MKTSESVTGAMEQKRDSVLGSIITNPIDDDDSLFLEEYLKQRYQRALYSSWVTFINPTGQLQYRIIVISNFRLVAFKVVDRNGTKSRQLTYNIPIIQLNTIHMDENDTYSLMLEFQDYETTILSPYTANIAKAIMFGYLSTTQGFPEQLMPVVSLPKSIFNDFKPPNPDQGTGLIATYLAMCDHMGVPARSQIIDYLVRCLHKKDLAFNFRDCLYGVTRPTPGDVDAITASLRFNSSFETLTIAQISISDESFKSIAKIFQYNAKIRHLQLISVKVGRDGISPLIKYIRKGTHSLISLSISDLFIGDQKLEKLANALEASRRPLRKLVLHNVGMTNLSLLGLLILLSHDEWCKYLYELDISDNKFKGEAAIEIAEFMKKSQGLQSFSMVGCGLDITRILEAIRGNNMLLQESLKLLNISSNKLTAPGMRHLSKIIDQSWKLQDIMVADMNVKKISFFDQILRSIALNSRIEVFLDISFNEIGSAVTKRFENALSKTPLSFRGLSLAHNEMGVEGIVSLVTELDNFRNLHTLNLDCNVSPGLFTKVTDAGEALGSFVNRSNSLRVLSMAGDDRHYLKGGLIPLFEALYENETLVELNIDSNRFTDETFESFFELVKRNRRIRVLSADHNRWTIQLIRDLADAVNENQALWEQSIIPLEEIQALFSASPRYSSEVRQLVSMMELKIRLNKSNAQVDEDIDFVNLHKRQSILDSDVGRSEYIRSPSVVLNKLASDVEIKEDFDEDLKNEGLLDKPLLSLIKPERRVYTRQQLAVDAAMMPRGVNPRLRELYLTEDEFLRTFGVAIEKYAEWPEWRRTQKKKEANLF